MSGGKTLRAADAIRRLRALGNPEQAAFAQRYFKTGPGEYAEGDRFLGLRAKDLHALAREFQALPPGQVATLLRSTWHEARLLALLVLVRQYPKATPKARSAIYRLYLTHTARINNWDLVDCSAGPIVGAHLAARDRSRLRRLARSRLVWERRIAIIATSQFIGHGDFDDTLAIAEALLDDDHDLIHKAVGWMLREVGKRDRPAEEAFLRAHAARMPRTMLRYAIERFPEALRRRYLRAGRRAPRAAAVVLLLACLVGLVAAPAAAQQLDPGTYTPTPVGANVLVLGNTLQGGDLSFDPTGPIQDASATINLSTLGYIRSFGLWGRSANAGVALPYLLGDLEGLYLGTPQQAHRSGLGDAQGRFSVNLFGAPAMTPREFADYRRRTVVGFSLTTVAPTGQYGGSKLVNIANRWSCKPEVGITHAFGPWRAEVFLGAWFFTDNDDFAGGRTREQDPILSTQFHLTRTFRRGLWAAFNANFYTGGRTTINGTENLDLQRNSRVGATVSLPVGGRRSLKIAYARGAYTTIGADFHSLGVSVQSVWFGRP